MRTRSLILPGLLSAAMFALAVPTPAQAVVYCRAAGVPAGCVVRPAPAARAAVYCTRPGFPAGCVAGAGAPGVGVAPGAGVGRAGVGVNTGGPVNRVGVR